MKWHKTEWAFVIGALALVLCLMLLSLIPLSYYCNPDREATSEANNGTSSYQKYSSEHESPFVKIVKAIFDGQQAQYEANARKSYGDSWWKSFSCDMRVTDFLLAYFTFGLVLIGALQGYLLKRSVDSVQASSEKQLRAYISVRGSQISGLASAPTFSVEVINAGQTPAHKMTSWIGSAFRPFPLTGPLVPHPNPNYAQSLGPGVPSIIIKNPKRPFNEAEIQQMTDRTHALYIFGCCDYQDIFGMKRFTKFCFFYQVDLRDGVGLKRYKEGNEAD